MENYGVQKTTIVINIVVGVRRKPLRIVVTRRVGFVGIHLVDLLLERGNNMIAINNLFTGRKDNVIHHLNNP